jgi:hypothetical protein
MIRDQSKPKHALDFSRSYDNNQPIYSEMYEKMYEKSCTFVRVGVI